MIPTKASLEKILPGFYDKYDPHKRENPEQYLELLKDRFQQRREYLQNSDVSTKPELLKELTDALVIKE